MNTSQLVQVCAVIFFIVWIIVGIMTIAGAA